jgi:hypothetical protein
MGQVGQPPHRLVGVLRAARGHLEGVLLSEERIDADVGAGLPGPVGEQPAVLEAGLAAKCLDVTAGQSGQAGVRGADEGIPRVSGFAREHAGSTLPSSLFSRGGGDKENVTAPG